MMKLSHRKLLAMRIFAINNRFNGPMHELIALYDEAEWGYHYEVCNEYDKDSFDENLIMEAYWHLHHDRSDIYKKYEHLQKVIDKEAQKINEEHKDPKLGYFLVIMKNDPFDDMPAFDVDVEEIVTNYIRVREYKSYAEALNAYADTRCIWSVLMYDWDAIQDFLPVAAKAIINHDYDWLQANFT